MALIHKLSNDPIQRQNYQIAIREAGHAVAACALGLGLKKRGIVLSECDPVGTAPKVFFDGFTDTSDYDRRNPNLAKQIAFHRRNIVAFLAGPAAERIVNSEILEIDWAVDNITKSLSTLMPDQQSLLLDATDEDQAEFWWLVHTLATCTDQGKAIQQLIEFETKFAQCIFDFLWPLAQNCHNLISTHWGSIQRVAYALMKTGKLTRDQLEALLPWVETNLPWAC